MKIIVLSFTILENVPLAAGYVVAAARASFPRDTIELWDEACESADERALLNLSKKIQDAEPSVLAFSTYVWNLKRSLAVAKFVKEAAPHITIVFGGPGATFTAEYLLSKYESIDYVVRGEGEEAFVELIASLKEGKTPTDVKGISWRHNDTIAQTQNRPAIADLDSVPSPYLTGVLSPKNELLIETHRGCVFKCGYCQEARGYSGIRPFSLKRISQEIEWAESRAVRRISFVNSIFNINPQRTEELCLMLAGRKNDIKYSIDSYAMLLNQKTIDLYRQANIYGTDIGLQSTNRAALIAMKRPWIEPARFMEKHELLKEAGIKTSVHVIIGLPGDTFQSFKQSYDFAESLEPTNVAAFKLLVLPGTPFAQEAKHHGLVASDEPPFSVISSNTFSAEEVRLAEVYAESRYKEFLMKNAYRVRSRIIAPVF